jgi:murein DD-endopeptidase MepM/ murein hydrolase activator NlpD
MRSLLPLGYLGIAIALASLATHFVWINDEGQPATTRLGGDAENRTPPPESRTASARSDARRLGDALHQSAMRNGLQRTAIAEFLDAISLLVDPTMPVSSGDWVKVETNPTGTRVIAASFSIAGFRRTLYRFTTAEGVEGFYGEQGRSIEAKISRKPIQNAVFSAGFELRRDPILGRERLHSGLDWSAAAGEPIYAAAPGMVVRISADEVSGNSLEIAHEGLLTTVYDHLSLIGPGIAIGSQPGPGTPIGFVGSTGRSTGPHLHYEVRLLGSPVDPLGEQVPSERLLSGEDLTRFLQLRAKMDQRLVVAAVLSFPE